MTKQPGDASAGHQGYAIQPYDPEHGEPDRRLTQVGRGTPGGDYLRRYWHPVAFEREIEDVPLRVRILGENLVLFRDRRGEIGLLHLHCCHRGASLEFGIIESRGIRCCYHGRLFDTDGTILEIPGEPAQDKLRESVRQGAYPITVYAGMVFTYLGPSDKKPPFPIYDSFDVPGVKLVPSSRLPFACNWTQIKDNAMDPAHTAVLHAIEGPDQFSPSFGVFPEMRFARSPIGLLNVCARRVGNLVWVRSTDIIMPTIHSISSIIEDGRAEKSYSPPWLTIWTTPVDDNNSINFLLSHLSEFDTTPAERRRYLEEFGQSPDRPYRDRQKMPGDYDAVVSQGPTAIHAHEHLGTIDAGVMLFRRVLREGIEAVERGEDPPHPVVEGSQPIPTYVNNQAVLVARKPTVSEDREALSTVCRQVIASSLRAPPQTLRPDDLGF